MAARSTFSVWGFSSVCAGRQLIAPRTHLEGVRNGERELGWGEIGAGGVFVWSVDCFIIAE